DIADRLFVPARDLPEGEARIPLKEVQLNRCPALVSWRHLADADFERLGIDVATVEARAARLREAGPALAEKVRRVFAMRAQLPPGDADGSLYDGFVPGADRRRLAAVRATPPRALGSRAFGFGAPRPPGLLGRHD